MKKILRIVIYALISSLSACLTALLLHLGYYYQSLSIISTFALIFSALLYTSKWHIKSFYFLTASIFLFFALVVYLVMRWEDWGAPHPDSFTEQKLNSAGKLLILVPHQDDELNIVAGLLEDIEDKSKIYIAFSTNADTGRGTKNVTRLREALRVASFYGIPRENIIFLGYGNEWDPNRSGRWGEPYKHLYNVEDPNAVWPSLSGHTETWGAEGLMPLKPNTPYTKNNFKDNIKYLISSIHPDTIICIDYDLHPDHRALSLTFERVMGEMLREDTQYTPVILKGFAYSTAWLGAKDFYSFNPQSTKNTQDSRHMCEVNYYQWKDRLRFPVSRRALNRTLSGNSIYQAFRQYKSVLPSSGDSALTMINSDRVFWWRPSSGLLYNADFSVDSDIEHASQLHDFMVIDSDDVGNFSKKPFDHGWCPDNGLGSIHVTLDQPSTITEIRLYDHVDENRNVKNAVINLSNGTTIETGPLPDDGAPLIIPTNTTDIIDHFSVTITSSTGQGAGFAEIEAYRDTPFHPFRISKLMDRESNFMYHYYTPQDGEVAFSIYQSNSPQLNTPVVLDGDSPLQPDSEGYYHCRLTKGASTRIRLLSDNELLDEVTISNPSILKRWALDLQQKIDPFMSKRTPCEQRNYYSDFKHFYLKKIGW